MTGSVLKMSIMENAAGNYFQDVIAVDNDLKIQFEYAVIDPQGNPFDGVEYFQTSIATSCGYDDTFFSANGGLVLYYKFHSTSTYYCLLLLFRC